MEVIDQLNWRKSTYSGNGGADCVEAGNSAWDVHLRDSKDRDGAQVMVPAAGWRAFVGRIQRGQ
jgi:uncharacterized protein DUF397